MDRTEWDTHLAALAAMPAFLERALAGLPAAHVRTRSQAGDFALVEQIWHLADLEREGYGLRIARILAEDEPELPDFEGDRIARERCYVLRDAREGLALFRAAREHNLAALRRATAGDLARRATQDQVGRITLTDVPRMMARHDDGHRHEIEELIDERARGSPSFVDASNEP